MPYDPTTRAILEAIEADVRVRVDRIVDRVEREVDRLHGGDELETAIHDALVDVTEVVAEGMVARLREIRRARAAGPGGQAARE